MRCCVVSDIFNFLQLVSQLASAHKDGVLTFHLTIRSIFIFIFLHSLLHMLNSYFHECRIFYFQISWTFLAVYDEVVFMLVVNIWRIEQFRDFSLFFGIQRVLFLPKHFIFRSYAIRLLFCIVVIRNFVCATWAEIWYRAQSPLPCMTVCDAHICQDTATLLQLILLF